MRKDRVYKVIISLSKTTWDMLSAACGCPGGCGPVASCKHIAALCYAFCDFCEHGVLPHFLTCTDKLSKWNRPRSKKVDPIPVSDVQAHQLVKKIHTYIHTYIYMAVSNTYVLIIYLFDIFNSPI